MAYQNRKRGKMVIHAIYNKYAKTNLFLEKMGKEKILKCHTSGGKSIVQICIEAYNVDALTKVIEICGKDALMIPSLHKTSYVKILFRQMHRPTTKKSIDDPIIDKFINIFYHVDYDLDILVAKIPYHSTWTQLLMDKNYFLPDSIFSKMMEDLFDSDKKISENVLTILKNIINHPYFTNDPKRMINYANIYFINYFLSEETNLPPLLEYFLGIFGDLTKKLVSDVEKFKGDFLITECAYFDKVELFDYLLGKGVHLLNYPINILEYFINRSHLCHHWVKKHNLCPINISNNRDIIFENNIIDYILKLLETPIAKTDKIKKFVKNLVVLRDNFVRTNTNICINCGQKYLYDSIKLIDNIDVYHIESIYDNQTEKYKTNVCNEKMIIKKVSFCSKECQDAWY